MKSAFAEIPMVRLLIPLLAGILMGIWLWLSPLILLCSLIAVIALGVILLRITNAKQAYQLRHFSGTALVFLLFNLGYLLSVLHQHEYRNTQQQLVTADHVILKLTEPPSPTINGIKGKAKLVLYSKDGSTYRTNSTILYEIKNDSRTDRLQAGDLVAIRSDLLPIAQPTNPHEFNYAAYLANQHIYYQTTADYTNWKLIEESAKVNWLTKQRSSLEATLDTYLKTEEEVAIAKALLLGNKDLLSDELKDSYTASGAMHILAVSGLHVGIVAYGVLFLLAFMDRKPKLKWLKLDLVVLVIWGFAAITGFSPSVLRAATMFSFLILGKGLSRYNNTYNLLAASAFLLLLINPLLIAQVGFQLSYLAVLGIVYVQPRLSKLWVAPNKFLHYAWQLVTVSVAAQLATFPLSLLYFHQFPTYFAFTNLPIIPLVIVIVYGGMLLFISSLVPVIASVVGWLLQKAIWLLNAIVGFISDLPAAVIDNIGIGTIETTALYGLIILLLLFFAQKQPRWFIASGSIAFALCLFWMAEGITHSHQNQLVIYNSSASSVDLFNGKQAYHLGNSSSTYHSENNRIQHGIKQVEMLSANYLESSGKRVLLIDHKDNIPLYGNYDILVLSKGITIDLARLQKEVDFSLLVADGSNRADKAEGWATECQQLGIPFHNVKTDQALILDLKKPIPTL